MIKTIKYSTLLSALLLLISCGGPTEKVDLLVHNANIYTVNDLFEVSQAMVINNGKIVAIGAENKILNKYKFAADKVIDAKKRFIFPGFIDGHCHFINYSKNLQEVNLTGTKSMDEVIDRVKAFAKTNNNEWIIGRGWDQNDWETKEFPNRFELDKLFPNQPVLLTRIDGHAALANKKALQIAGINSETKIEGGIITSTFIPNGDTNWVFDANYRKELSHQGYPNWEPLGILVDNAIELVAKHIPANSQNQLTSMLIKAEQKMFEVGLTTLDDAGLNKTEIELIDKLQQEKKLKIKIYAMISGNQEMLDYYLAKGPYKTDLLNVCSFKFYADGALGSRGACLLEPYADLTEQDHYGLMTTDEEFFNKYAPLLYEKGFQMNTHCIGDSANRMVLDIYGKTLKGVNDKRWRIEHAQVIHSEDFKKFNQFTIIPSIQSTHATSDMYWAEERLGNERIKGAYAYKELLAQNGMITLGTDFPVEGINPMNTFYAAVVRKDSKGYPKEGYQMENALSRKEALKGMTIWAAIANFEELEKGSLEVGKAADFIILDQDLITAPEENLLNIKVLQTFINGENVFSRDQTK